MSMLSYFTDAVLRGPTIGSMLMCLAAGLIGVVIFLRKQSLIGEALSHAAYPGVILAAIFAGLLAIDTQEEILMALGTMACAFLTALLGLWIITQLVRKLHLSSDSALCFVLSLFFGIGLTLASYLQFSNPGIYRQTQVYLYGQAATMTDVNIAVYGTLALLIIITMLIFEKELQTITFNRDFAISLGINVSLIDFLVFILTTLAVVIGIRSVGVVLMSAMLISPVAAARQFTNKFRPLLFLSAFFGVLSAYLGTYLSVEWSHKLALQYSQTRLALPTGPMIVLVASCICLISLLIAPERGILIRLLRMIHFRNRCLKENLLKAIWRLAGKQPVTLQQIAQYQNISTIYLRWVLSRLAHAGLLTKIDSESYQLTNKGYQRASNIIRLHRLWEVYLVDYVSVGAERVHRSAEEMEHILTPELEAELTLLLNDPQQDPHHQKIPPKIDEGGNR